MPYEISFGWQTLTRAAEEEAGLLVGEASEIYLKFCFLSRMLFKKRLLLFMMDLLSI